MVKLSIEFNAFDDDLTVAGIKASGKSVFVKWFAKRVVHDQPYIIYDPNEQHDELGYVCEIPSCFNLNFKRLKHIVYQPKEDTKESFDEFCKLLHYRYDNFIFIIEEADRYFVNSPFPLKGESGHFYHKARNRGVSFIAVTRRPQCIHKDVINNSRHLAIFNLHSSDLKYLEREFKLENIWLIKDQPPYHSLYYRDERFIGVLKPVPIL